MTENGLERMMGYAPTYYPGMTRVTDAEQMALGVAQEISGTDFSVMPGRAASVSGTAFDSRGQPIGGRRIGLTQEVQGPGAGAFFTAGGATTAGDGTFTIADVAPGQYKLTVQATSGGPTPQGPVQEQARLTCPPGLSQFL